MIKFSDYDYKYVIDAELRYIKIIDNILIDYDPIKKYKFGKNQIAYTTLICNEKIK